MSDKKTYFYSTMDEGKAFFESPEKLIEHIKGNTSHEETIEVGCEELSATEWARLQDHEDFEKSYKDEDNVVAQ